MTSNQQKVLESFEKLSASEKEEVLKLIIMNISNKERIKLFSNLSESRIIGVVGNNPCPVCGKSQFYFPQLVLTNILSQVRINTAVF